ncbi:hypothetical protein ALC57_12407 [Trachymyrmex cornetzi]|uniref:Uncharacterized protein n=1 Tax=Trachymyrmex cornetzi TaxID=471704 RepID=A0A195DR62_9HYME|nr:hypothetical protein ALC57_12407 [Trachymyrmex cornetzi]
MRGCLQILQRYRTYAYATEGSAQDWIRRIDNKQSRTRKGAIFYLPVQNFLRIAAFRPSGHKEFRHQRGVRKKRAAITLVESRKRRGWRTVRGEISPITQTAYGGARRTHRNTNTNLIRWWDGIPLDGCMRDTVQGDTCSITRLDAGRDGRMRSVRWIVRNILRQAMPNIMPATSTDAGRPVLAAL